MRSERRYGRLMTGVAVMAVAVLHVATGEAAEFSANGASASHARIRVAPTTTGKPLGPLRGQVELFGLRSLAQGQIPNVPVGIDKLFVPNFEKSRTADIKGAVINLQEAYPDRTIVPYLPVRKYTRRQAQGLLRFFRRRKIKELVVLAGGSFSDAEQRGAFPDTRSFLEQIDLRGYGIGGVGVAAHPEHHFLMDKVRRMDVLQEKHDVAKSMGLDVYLLTNVVAKPEAFHRWQQEVRASGIQSDIHYGIALPGMTQQEYRRFTVDMCQAITTDPHHPDYDPEAVERIDSLQRNSLPNVRQELAAKGIDVGFHFYMYGKDRAAGLVTLEDWLGSR